MPVARNIFVTRLAYFFKMGTKNILLSICIPTFNRAKYLDKCLAQFCQQAADFPGKLEIIVSDNASNDNTTEIVKKYNHKYCPISYNKNEINIGADANIIKLLSQIRGKYFWVFGDDDILLDGKLRVIFKALNENDVGMIYLENYWFQEDFEREKPRMGDSNQIEIFLEKKSFLKKINIWTTFLSAGIFDKSVLLKVDLQAYVGTNLNQLQWVLPAIFMEKQCLYIGGLMIACKGANTGGYGLFKTFGTSLNQIVTQLQLKGLVTGYCLDVLNFYFIKDFMPVYCIKYKQNKLDGFDNEPSPFAILRPLYKKYFIYWLVLAPIDVLPAYIGKKYYFGLKWLKLI
jgi:abequosyltransferase